MINDQSSERFERIEQGHSRIEAELERIAELQRKAEEQRIEYEKQRIEYEKQREEDRKQREEDRKQREEDWKKSERETAELKQSIKAVNELYGGFSESAGMETEDLFYAALDANPTIGSIQFDYVTPNLRRRSPDRTVEVEIDLMLLNDTRVGLVEVKRHGNLQHMEKMHTKTLPAFRRLYPEYARKEIYVVFAVSTLPKESSARRRFMRRLDELGYGLLTVDHSGTKVICEREATRPAV